MIIMQRQVLFTLGLMMVAPLSAAPRKVAPMPLAKPLAEATLIKNCDAHKFETVVDTLVNGQPRKSKVKLCGVAGQGDTEWVGTLRDAIRKLEINKDMAGATRDQIVAAIKAEIARLSIVGTSVPPKLEVQEQSSTTLSRDYTALPPLPVAPATTPAPTSALPPAGLPPAGVRPAAAPPAAVPRLTISCESTTDLAGPAQCVEFERDTRLTVQADGEVPAGTELQFVRNGRAQGQLSLGGLRKGSSLRSSLPGGVCAGFGAGRLELRIVQGGGAQAIRSEGPYSLRC